jgi:vacuolar-type H+-ATPase catalytic subunit A/Vma1
VANEPLTIEAVERQLRYFEDLYGVPSERLADAFRTSDGRLKELPDFHRWSLVYAAYLVAREASEYRRKRA